MRVEHDVPLAPWTTLGLGGRAARVTTIEHDSEVADALREADAAGHSAFVLGGGSNVVIGDDGLDAWVLRMATRGISVAIRQGCATVTLAAGEPWDAFVEQAVHSNYSGVECLSGIPGLVGATPIQNVGAYGQEVKNLVVEVRAIDRRTREFVTLSRADCEFGYRASRLKTTDRYVVTAVTLALLVRDESIPIAYPELARALGIRDGETASLSAVRDVVLQLRRGKGMVVDSANPESRSVGSFFVNPVVSEAEIAVLDGRAQGAGVGPVPRFSAGDGRWKVPAAWLIERAGFPRGYGTGRVRVSHGHALALVHAGGGTTRELLSLAREIQQGVAARFGVVLTLEPRLVGCSLPGGRATADVGLR